jgi:hypothetical protein
MYKKIIAILLLVFSTTLLQAQSKYTVSGTVKQKTSGETLIGVSVVVVEKPNVGVITNEYGFYSLSLPKGNYTLRVTYVGYKQELIPVKLDGNVTISIDLSDQGSMQEVVVGAKKTNGCKDPGRIWRKRPGKNHPADARYKIQWRRKQWLFRKRWRYRPKPDLAG